MNYSKRHFMIHQANISNNPQSINSCLSKYKYNPSLIQFQPLQIFHIRICVCSTWNRYSIERIKINKSRRSVTGVTKVPFHFYYTKLYTFHPLLGLIIINLARSFSVVLGLSKGKSKLYELFRKFIRTEFMEVSTAKTIKPQLTNHWSLRYS